ncbi:hypothetical protein M0813_09847 [Anaeramoeba flamelloides]|uniref:ADF-H domain-containing protein n=1 Tax=Anaeramoeba flamelloides TaxID=1746091 RepID=A0ABQ8X5K7_9EUKA|nr:hypothetical protein M0813_09847 [Anaeramoeba flamelloides]
MKSFKVNSTIQKQIKEFSKYKKKSHGIILSLNEKTQEFQIDFSFETNEINEIKALLKSNRPSYVCYNYEYKIDETDLFSRFELKKIFIHYSPTECLKTVQQLYNDNQSIIGNYIPFDVFWKVSETGILHNQSIRILLQQKLKQNK